MTYDDGRDNGTYLDFDSNERDLSSTSFIQTRSARNPRDIRLFHDMLDGEIDSDPQISDSELSWQSVTDVDSQTATNHWRGWKQQSSTTATTNPNSSGTNLNLSSLQTSFPSSLGHASMPYDSEGQHERIDRIHRDIFSLFRSYWNIG